MNEEINCIANKGKTTNNERETDYSDFLWALYNLYKKIRKIILSYVVLNVFKERYISSVKSDKYLNKLVS